MLHVTNGDIVVGSLAASGLAGDRLGWVDVLHEGPVRGGISDEQLCAERAAFLAEADGRAHEDVFAPLERRDRRLAEAAGRDEIVLWFEADLYDQLQLIQILDRLEPHGVELICIHDHPSVERFYGLGQLEAHVFPELFEKRVPVTAEQTALARRAWAAFRERSPESLDALRREEPAALPYLAAALTRLLEELPWTTDGLSRTERSLAALADAPATSADAFRAYLESEERPFLGDTWAFDRLAGLAANGRPLLEETAGGRYVLTHDGERVLASEVDALELRGIDRWLGGTHIGRPDPVWRWDPDRARAVLG
jgi:hypothetical protein